MILKNEHFVNKFELYLFAGFLFLNLIPVFLFKYLPTLDGPAHLHNANLIYNMVLGDSSFLANFYQITKELLPNWSGHFILSSLNSFLPGWLAEKTLVTLYLVFLPLSFRWFIKSISPENYLLSYFIFPFCYSFTFFLGFYNFSLALILLFLLLAFWIKVQKTLKPVNIILLFILFTTLYFSHVFVFLISILATGVIILTQLFDDYEKTSGSQSFQQFLKSVGIKLSLNVKSPRLDKKLPSTLSVDEIFYLLDSIKNEDLPTRFPLRDKAIFELIYATGIRCSELVEIKLSDIDFEHKAICVLGKGRKERMVLFGSKAEKSMQAYLKVERFLLIKQNERDFLFLNYVGGKLTSRSVQRIFEMFRKFLKIERKLTPHKIRHSFATHLLNQGVDLRMIQELLGHKTIATTEIYTQVSSAQLAKMCAEKHPLNNMDHLVLDDGT